ncbi:MAG: ribonucleotide-diphosphate reductase subunit beta, partial [Pseudomonadota bacterium]
FEARATEYSKGATTGEWHGAEGVWAQFDQWKGKQGVATE